MIKIYNEGLHKLNHEYEMKRLADHIREYDLKLLRINAFIKKNWEEQLNSNKFY